MHHYRIDRSEVITPGTLLITLSLEDGSSPMLFQPGQYAVIMPRNGLRPMAARCFSMTSSPVDTGVLQFSMRIRGSYTTRLSELAVGTRVDVRGPFGSFVLPAHRPHRAVLLAGGIGITPFMSMVRTAARTDGSMPLVLHYSVRNQDDVPFGAELTELAQQFDPLQVQFVVGEGEVNKLHNQGVSVASGFITDATIRGLTPDAFDDPSTTFYLCGPPPFMNAATKMLIANGVDRHRIVTEAFSQGSGRQSSRAIDWPYNMYSLSAIGLSVTAMAIVLHDAIEMLPSATRVGAQLAPVTEVSRREADIDAIVAQLADMPIQNDSAALAAAKAAVATPAETPAEGSSPAPAATPRVLTPSPTQPVVVPTPVPAPPPVPVCTTNQSGVTTCQ